jgi:glycosyltransferase involved in cell wall biosynthesis
VQVLRTMLVRLPTTAGAAPQVEVIQGVDRTRAGDRRTQTMKLMQNLPGVRVHPVDVGQLGQFDSRPFDRALKVKHLVQLRFSRSQLTAIAREFAPDVIYSSQQIWDLKIATPLARALRVPQVVHLHYHCGPWLGRGTMQTLRQARLVIGVSDFIRENAIEHGVPADRARVLYNGVDLPKDPPLDRWIEGRARFRAELRIPRDTILVGMTARLTMSKGQEELLEAMLPIMEEKREVHLVIAGSEFPKPNGIMARMRQAAQAHGVASQLHILGHRQDVSRILDALDIFGHPSHQEPCSIAVLEAQAHGLPVVAWRDGGTATLVADGETGLLAPTGEIAELTRRLRTLVDDEFVRLAMGRQARQRIGTAFHPGLQAAGFRLLLEEAAGPGPAPDQKGRRVERHLVATVAPIELGDAAQMALEGTVTVPPPI